VRLSLSGALTDSFNPHHASDHGFEVDW